jgi:hypothetical protein
LVATEDATMTDENAARLLDAIRGIDLSSADGRAGIGSILAEIERVSPGAILQRAAAIELRRISPSVGRP